MKSVYRVKECTICSLVKLKSSFVEERLLSDWFVDVSENVAMLVFKMK